jgi:hypothetical protein
MAGVEDLVNSLQKKFGKEVVAGNNTQGVEFVSSGSLSLDLALGGGCLVAVMRWVVSLNCVATSLRERLRWL